MVLSKTIHSTVTSQKEHWQTHQKHWDFVARKMDSWHGWGGYYQQRLAEIYKNIIPAGQRVVEIGCSQGNLLAALEPKLGIGIDFSAEMLVRAANEHSNLYFVQADAQNLCLDETFDFIIFSDLLNDLWDVEACLKSISRLVDSRTRIIINFYSRLWEIPLLTAQHLGLANPKLEQNWLTVEDVKGLLRLADFEIVRNWEEIIFPFPIPLLNTIMNRVLVKTWPFSYGALTNFVIARPHIQKCTQDDEPLVSIVVPARNEAGNIVSIFERIPHMGSGVELIFVEGHSTDGTYEVIQQVISEYPEFRCQLLRQNGIGKGDAVRLGFEHATGDVLMILDADLTVLPEVLPRFYEALVTGKGEFINGIRLVYPMENQAMRFLNLLGNKFFSIAFSWLLGQPIKDTLCGTKVLWKEDYERIAKNREYFGDFDPFGDFDLLFGAAKLNLTIIGLPIRYQERKYGSTNIRRWRHGWLLLKMVIFAARRIKFV